METLFFSSKWVKEQIQNPEHKISWAQLLPKEHVFLWGQVTT